MSKWRKQYAFRLTENEQEVYEFLEQIPKNKRSETIRKMLAYTLQHMESKQTENSQYEIILKELALLKEQQQENHMELLTIINSNGVEAKIEDKKQDNQALTDSANALLESFGVEF